MTTRLKARRHHRRAGRRLEHRRPPLGGVLKHLFAVEADFFDRRRDADGEEVEGDYTSTGEELAEAATTRLSKASLVASGPREAGMHRLAIDLDFPVEVYASSTPGHHHLYVDHEIPWEKYLALLSALAGAGLIEGGYLNASRARGFTTLRLPWVRKVEPEPVRECRMEKWTWDHSGQTPSGRDRSWAEGQARLFRWGCRNLDIVDSRTLWDWRILFAKIDPTVLQKALPVREERTW